MVLSLTTTLGFDHSDETGHHHLHHVTLGHGSIRNSGEQIRDEFPPITISLSDPFVELFISLGVTPHPSQTKVNKRLGIVSFGVGSEQYGRECLLS